MKVSELWLREWVNPSITTEQLAAQLTMAGLEVDSVAPVAGSFNRVVVAKVLETMPHPQADKLTLCRVDCGAAEPLQIVCGASNVRANLKVALAMTGATLPNGMTIKETKLRGELSQGMLCSTGELGMFEQNEGIIELPDDAPIGKDFREYMQLNDVVLDVDLTPNRADCFSVRGIAREIATLNKVPLVALEYKNHQPIHDQTIAVQLNEPDACPQYYGRIIRNINPDACAPQWLLERLRRAGIRPIHPVVDAMNYVMLELGQPMHAFNLDTLKGNIQVRCAVKGETLTLLDNQTVELNEKTLVIADSEKSLAIAGIMGGAGSAVESNTVNIFIESAFFNPVRIAGIARQYGLCTESSQRFERGVDPAIQLPALEYATDLLNRIVGGEIGPIICVQNKETMPVQKKLTFNPEQVMKLTGVCVSEQEMVATLSGLGIDANTQVRPWAITIPSHRFDIELEVDLVEEIIRIYGYDRILAQPMVARLQSGLLHAGAQLSHQIGQFLSHRGYHEVISYSFVDPDIQTAIYPNSPAMTLLNPISSELAQMRIGLWPGLLASMIYNSHRQQPLIRLFESGVVFDISSGELVERACVAGLIAGEIGQLNWAEKTRSLDFYDLKGDIQALFRRLGLDTVEWVQATHPGLHPGKSAQIQSAGQFIGWVGVLHPRLATELSLDDEVILFEIDLASLQLKHAAQYQKISKFPSVRRDLSFLIDSSINAAEIEAVVRDVTSAEILKSFDVFDIYVGESIPDGKKSVAIALTLQDSNRTLVDEDINTFIDAVVKNLNRQFGVVLRD